MNGVLAADEVMDHEEMEDLLDEFNLGDGSGGGKSNSRGYQ